MTLLNGLSRALVSYLVMALGWEVGSYTTGIISARLPIYLCYLAVNSDKKVPSASVHLRVS
jgi:hypothetical protein